MHFTGTGPVHVMSDTIVIHRSVTSRRVFNGCTSLTQSCDMKTWPSIVKKEKKKKHEQENPPGTSITNCKGKLHIQ